MSYVFVVLVGVLGGLAGALQSQFLGVMEQRVGTLASTFVTYGGGGLAIGLLMLAFRGGRLAELKDLPWWVFTAGLMGLVVVASLGITVNRLGLGAGLTLFTAATLILGAAVEHLGWFGEVRTVDGARALGVAIMIFGTWLVVRG
ncbi:MAG TPA: DMT family transporter [Acidimicrobiia bacterium]|nr:DMT family transporter [Acidimicrobiia bacterium]